MSPAPHATPPSDAHTEQHSPNAGGGEGGLGVASRSLLVAA